MLEELVTKQKQIAGLLLLAAITAALTPVVSGLAVILWVLTGILLVGACILALKIYSKKR